MKNFGVLFILLAIFMPGAFAGAQSVDILWQGETFTPPFYKGRPLWSNQSQIVLYAVPQIPGANPSSLNYKWTKNNVVLGTNNGIGRNTLIFSDSILGKPQEIKLEIISADGAILATKSVTVSPRNPDILAYENNPLYGLLLNREISSGYRMLGEEVTFTAFPLYFSAQDMSNSMLRYFWTTNTGGEDRDASVTYRVPDGASGTSVVRVRANHENKVVQSAEKSFEVEFGNR